MRLSLPSFLLVAFLVFAPSLSAGEIVAESTLLSVLHEAEIPAQDLGILKSLDVQEGDRVEYGQPLGHLNRTEAELQHEQATKQLEIAREEAQNDISQAIARKTIEVAKAEYKRAQEANKKYSETVSQTEVDRLRLVAEKSELEQEQAIHDKRVRQLNAELKKIQVDLTSAQLQRRSITSPLTGIVERIDVNPGEWVEPGTTLMRIIQLSQLKAEAVLPAEYRQRDLLDCRVTIPVPSSEKTSNSQGQTVTGRIRFVNPESDPIDGSFRIQAELDNTNRLLHPGQSVTMTIHPDDRKTESASP